VLLLLVVVVPALALSAQLPGGAPCAAETPARTATAAEPQCPAADALRPHSLKVEAILLTWRIHSPHDLIPWTTHHRVNKLTWCGCFCKASASCTRQHPSTADSNATLAVACCLLASSRLLSLLASPDTLLLLSPPPPPLLLLLLLPPLPLLLLIAPRRTDAVRTHRARCSSSTSQILGTTAGKHAAAAASTLLTPAAAAPATCPMLVLLSCRLCELYCLLHQASNSRSQASHYCWLSQCCI
jgi:hypothetical protein